MTTTIHDSWSVGLPHAADELQELEASLFLFGPTKQGLRSRFRCSGPQRGSVLEELLSSNNDKDEEKEKHGDINLMCNFEQMYLTIAPKLSVLQMRALLWIRGTQNKTKQELKIQDTLVMAFSIFKLLLSSFLLCTFFHEPTNALRKAGKLCIAF
ncbi:unnamed protein product [Sphenostylis stenocarpa]|uniref:Uncharacterized protein n=1 Tax=Sphenostylis stenocarpa TaxID=92480 RepID=A0AA86SYZ8_9FABA|nr:unnamed protein product [Sphenostylis stenocarpa]